ncbi:orn/Lys/Arg decarboxylase, C-terminal domain protein, partial [Vibrio parahaemolyticus V-223/04]
RCFVRSGRITQVSKPISTVCTNKKMVATP